MIRPPRARPLLGTNAGNHRPFAPGRGTGPRRTNGRAPRCVDTYGSAPPSRRRARAGRTGVGVSGVTSEQTRGSPARGHERARANRVLHSLGASNRSRGGRRRHEGHHARARSAARVRARGVGVQLSRRHQAGRGPRSRRPRAGKATADTKPLIDEAKKQLAEAKAHHDNAKTKRDHGDAVRKAKVAAAFAEEAITLHAPL